MEKCNCVKNKFIINEILGKNILFTFLFTISMIYIPQEEVFYIFSMVSCMFKIYDYCYIIFLLKIF